MTDFSLNKRVAIVTGGASGIGRGIVNELAIRGAAVVLADIDGEKAGQAASELDRNGGRIQSRQLNVAQKDQIEQLIEQTASDYGRLDYLFNNAGVGTGGDVRDLDQNEWQRILSVNLWGVIYGSLSAYDVMVRQGFGHIVNTASLAGLIPAASTIPYGVSKHGVVGLSKSLRAEGADLGVKVSVVCPDGSTPRSMTPPPYSILMRKNWKKRTRRLKKWTAWPPAGLS